MFQPFFSYGLQSLTVSFFKQGLLKQLLTEGRFAVRWFRSHLRSHWHIDQKNIFATMLIYCALNASVVLIDFFRRKICDDIFQCSELCRSRWGSLFVPIQFTYVCCLLVRSSTSLSSHVIDHVTALCSELRSLFVGIYDVVHNLGSMIARFVFLPLEDSGYLFFSQALTRGQSAKAQEKVLLCIRVCCVHASKVLCRCKV